MSISSQYIKELHKEFGYFGTWLPGTPISVGDIGIIDKNGFIRHSSLKEMEIDFETVIDDTTEDIEYSSREGVLWHSKLSGQSPELGSSLTKTDAGISVKFSKENAILLMTKGVQTHLISNIPKLESDILRLKKKGLWRNDFSIITELKSADSSTILISNSSKSEIELRMKASMGSTEVNLADVEAGFSISSYKNMALKIIAERGLSFLFRAMSLKKSTFGGTSKLRSKGDSSFSSLKLTLEYSDPTDLDLYH